MVAVSDSNKFIFIHIPKTGGSSFTWNVRHYLRNEHGLDLTQENPAWRTKGWQAYFHVGCQHSKYIDQKKLFKQKSDHFSFAFVRNPWELMFSWFSSLHRNDPAHLTPANFREFVLRPPQTHNHLINCTQLSYISENDRIVVDHVARFEKYSEEMDFLSNRLGLEICNPREVNVSNKHVYDYRVFYDEEIKQYVYNKYNEDVRVFGYEFEGP